MKTYYISEVANLLDLPASTIRYYDSCGALPSVRRDNAGRRIFTESDINLIAAMRRGLDVGLSISEFRELYKAVMIHGSHSEGRDLLVRKINEIDDSICHLQSAQSTLKSLVKEYSKCIEQEKEGNLKIRL